MVFEGLRLVEWSTNANEWSDMFSNFVQLGCFYLDSDFNMYQTCRIITCEFVAVQINLKDIIANS